MSIQVGVVACLVILLGNLVLLGATAVARATAPRNEVDSVAGIDHLEAVDAKLWRGGAPSEDGYRRLAALGTTTVIDLRAEDDVEADGTVVKSLGMSLIRIPIRDGQAPTQAQVQTFLDATKRAPGLVFVHCGAGVGRTGTMVGAYLVSTGTTSGSGALIRNLAVGPPSLEQVLFVGLLDGSHSERPNALVRAVSRVLDAPRRIWVRVNPFG